LTEVIQAEPGHAFAVIFAFPAAWVFDGDPFKQMMRVRPPAQLVCEAVNDPRLRGSAGPFRVSRIQIVQNQAASGFQAIGHIPNDSEVFAGIVEITKACEEVEDVIRPVPAKWNSHVLPKEMEAGTLRLLRSLDTSGGKVDSSHTKSFCRQIPGVTADSTTDVERERAAAWTKRVD